MFEAKLKAQVDMHNAYLHSLEEKIINLTNYLEKLILVIQQLNPDFITINNHKPEFAEIEKFQPRVNATFRRKI